MSDTGLSRGDLWRYAWLGVLGTLVLLLLLSRVEGTFTILLAVYLLAAAAAGLFHLARGRRS